MRKHSLAVLQELLRAVAEKGANAIVTFPDHDCSNGLSGEIVKETAASFFLIKTTAVDSKFSTLGGNGGTTKTGNGREPRQMAKELILTLVPKKKMDGS
jgi:hypothetical protein